jgi:hypothetical protein
MDSPSMPARQEAPSRGSPGMPEKVQNILNQIENLFASVFGGGGVDGGRDGRDGVCVLLRVFYSLGPAIGSNPRYM